MTHRGPNPSPPVFPASRGKRYCSTCNCVTTHSVRTVLSPVGKTLMVASGVITIALIIHFFRIILDRVLLLVLCCGLSVVFGFILCITALRRKGYQVQCEKCSRQTYLFSPPRWKVDS